MMTLRITTSCSHSLGINHGINKSTLKQHSCWYSHVLIFLLRVPRLVYLEQYLKFWTEALEQDPVSDILSYWMTPARVVLINFSLTSSHSFICLNQLCCAQRMAWYRQTFPADPFLLKLNVETSPNIYAKVCLIYQFHGKDLWLWQYVTPPMRPMLHTSGFQKTRWKCTCHATSHVCKATCVFLHGQRPLHIRALQFIVAHHPNSINLTCMPRW